MRSIHERLCYNKGEANEEGKDEKTDRKRLTSSSIWFYKIEIISTTANSDYLYHINRALLCKGRTHT